jgi:ATP-dependent RNA helicase RhlE
VGWGEVAGLTCVCVYGGSGVANQITELKRGTEIVVCTPGRMIDILATSGGKITNLRRVTYLVLDEADRMFDMGFLPDVRRILSHLPAQRQTMLFSATFPPEIEQLAAQALKHPQRLAVGISKPATTVSHALYPVPQHLKTGLTLALLKQTDTRSVLIFTRTRHRASRLAAQLDRAGYRVASLHSDRSQNQRQAALDGFRTGAYQIMVATDIAARGIDVATISHVINYDIPDTTDAYIHRIGRTGRAEREGDAFTLITPADDAAVRAIERVLGQAIPRRRLDSFDYAAPPPPQQPQGPAGRQRPQPATQQPARHHANAPRQGGGRRGGRPTRGQSDAR